MEKIVVYTDGASRGNPGHASYGFAIFQNGQLIFKQGKYIGHATNNIAEYNAVIGALSYIQSNLSGVSEIELFADSNLVVQQLSGKFKIKSPHLLQLIQQIKKIEQSFKKVTYHHIPREQNKLADLLANQALDKMILGRLTTLR